MFTKSCSCKLVWDSDLEEGKKRKGKQKGKEWGGEVRRREGREGKKNLNAHKENIKIFLYIHSIEAYTLIKINELVIPVAI